MLRGGEPPWIKQRVCHANQRPPYGVPGARRRPGSRVRHLAWAVGGDVRLRQFPGAVRPRRSGGSRL